MHVKNLHILSLVIAMLVLLSGCSGISLGSSGRKSVTISPINSLFIEERKMEDKNYRVGETLTAYVGEPLIKKKTYMAKIQSKLAAQPSVNAVLSASGYGQIVLQRGRDFLVKYDVFIDGVKYSALEVNGPEGVVAVLFDNGGVIQDRVLQDGKLLPQSFKVTPINAYVTTHRPEEVLEKRIIENFEIIFGGVDNNQISMTYREYSPDDVARTAFFQELTYPTNSKTLRYKSLKIGVQNVSSEGITFEVISD